MASGVSEPTRRRRSPVAPALLIALGLGVATDYGVAVLSRDAGVGGGSTTASGVGTAGDGWSVRVWRGGTRDALNISLVRPAAGRTSGEASLHLPHSVWRSAYRRALRDPSIMSAFINGQAYGWPTRSWAGYFINARPSGSVNAWLSAPGSSQSRVLPYIPVVPGIVVNSSMYAAAWFGVLILVRRLARHRRKPGFCGECGYDVRGLITPRCPECGAGITALPATGA